LAQEKKNTVVYIVVGEHLGDLIFKSTKQLYIVCVYIYIAFYFEHGRIGTVGCASHYYDYYWSKRRISLQHLKIHGRRWKNTSGSLLLQEESGDC
jgi:hypothetical protein